MKKTIILFPVSCIIVMLIFSSMVKANHTSEELQKVYFEIGFKEVNEALNEGNEHFKQAIALPVQLPPVAFTHSFGRFNNLDGEMNDKYEIEFLHKDIPQNHYMIFVQPAKYGIKLRKDLVNNKLVDLKLKTKDRNEAIYSTRLVSGFNLLVFEKNGFQYVLSVDKRISDKVTSEILIEIANSI
jgi:hypothetical protein